MADWCKFSFAFIYDLLLTKEIIDPQGFCLENGCWVVFAHLIDVQGHAVIISWWRFLSVHFHLENNLPFDNQIDGLWGLIRIVDMLISGIMLQLYVREDRLDSFSDRWKNRKAFDYFGLFILIHATQINEHALKFRILYLHHNRINCCHAYIPFLLFSTEKRTPPLKLVNYTNRISIPFHLPVDIPSSFSTENPIIFIRN